MRERQTTKAHTYAYDNLAQLQDWIVETPKRWSETQSRTETASDRWDLNAGYDGAIKLARDGWLEGAARAQDALNAIAPKTPERATVNDFYGFRPNVPRYCAGAPDSMIRRSPSPRDGFGAIVTLYVPVNVSSGVRASNMANFGLGIAQYVNQLETDGVRVELHGVMTSEVSSKRVTFTWCVKRADQPLDLAVLAFSVGHPAMFRRLGFALLERCSARECYNYGYPVNATLDDLLDAPVNAYILNGVNDANRLAPTPAEALKYIAEQLDKLIGGDAVAVSKGGDAFEYL